MSQATIDARINPDSPKRVVLFEDDHIQHEWIKQVLEEAFPTILIEVYETESQFIRATPSFVASPPDLFILDILVRWENFDETDLPKTERYERESFFLAGFRSLEFIRNHVETIYIPVLLYSQLTKLDVDKQIHYPAYFLHKSDRKQELIASVSHMLFGTDLPECLAYYPELAKQANQTE